uniref:Transmembrane protein 107 n=2 Tax=Bos TaxID=9903 RepID=A0AAA9SD35_BOVIN
MGRISGLVPSRFLTLLAHLVVVITLFWSRDSNIQACLPLKFTPEEYEKQDIQLVAALSVTLALFAVELAGFFLGVSMFNSTQSLIYTRSTQHSRVFLKSSPPTLLKLPWWLRRNSLAVQWLGPNASTAAVTGSVPGGATKILNAESYFRSTEYCRLLGIVR